MAVTSKMNKLFKSEGKKVAQLIREGKEKQALSYIDKNKPAWEISLIAIWKSIVEEVGTETFDKLKSFHDFEIKAPDAFNPWEETIRKYIEATVADKVTNVSDTTKSKIKKIIDEHREQDADLDTIAKAINDEYTEFARYRAYRIARTEVVGASNYASIKSAEASGVVDRKEWVTSRDDRVRERHEKMHGDLVDLDKPFSNGLMFPGDYSANRPAETIQCRCTIAYKVASTPKPQPKPTPKPKPKPKPEPKPVRGHFTNGLTWKNPNDRDKIIDIVAVDMKVTKKKAETIAESVLQWSGTHYTTIRKIQRKELDPKQYPEAGKHAKNIDEYIKKSPAWGDSGTTYRGIGVDRETASDILKKLQKKNGKIDMMGASSWSSKLSTAENFASGGEVEMIFINAGATLKGTSMKHLSKFENEDEILVSKTAKYRAKSIKQRGNYYYIIEVEEI